ncbi:MAG: vanadium-dependent haloperoxidase [Pseudomonadota bacterium]
MPIDPIEKKRIEDAKEIRKREAEEAAKRAKTRAAKGPLHRQNKDEELLTGAFWAMSFTKGLEHSASTGLVTDPDNAKALRAAIDKGKIADFTTKVSLPTLLQRRRQWEAPTAGFVFDLQGPDAQAVTMPPAPALNAQDGTFDELAFEMAEVYELALLRDVPFSAFQDGSTNSDMAAAVQRLNDLPYAASGFPTALPDLVKGSPRPRTMDGSQLTAQTAFRGASLGADMGPYLSQFMLIGSQDGPNTPPEDQGKIAYGAQFIDQRVRNATKQDWMITWRDWLDVQNGADVRFDDTLFAPGTRFIHTPRDLATYVHDDALYQAYLNACLILLGMRAPFDPGFAELAGGAINKGKTTEKRNNATGFALFGGPHILSLVTEVATRGLKAVRYQKFQNHLRLRPETLAGRLARVSQIEELDEIKALPDVAGQLSKMAEQLRPVLRAVQAHNDAMGGEELPLLPMAFQEGSPMHPAYGAGHATVAGACVTVLKAFFDTTAQLTWKGNSVAFRTPLESGGPDGIPVQFATVDDGARLEMQEASKPLTLLGELNKLAANISIGRNMGGVHYFSDYYDSVRMGEEIAVGILEEQAQGYPSTSSTPADQFKLSLTPFDARTANKMVHLVIGKRVSKSDLRCE